tara:strand:+ start:55 stop:528 length:474 start_codon:yes stop_codon:yes gene_type:complete
MSTKNTKQNPMHQAIGFLARRDHSVHELRLKLRKKEHDEESVTKVLTELQSRDYLDDRRYAQMMLRHHYSRGQGPQKIRYLLSQNGVSNDIISEVFVGFDEDWFALAKHVRHKRFGNGFKSNDQSEMFKEKSKQMRFLMTRGFESDQIQYAIEQIDR